MLFVPHDVPGWVLRGRRPTNHTNTPTNTPTHARTHARTHAHTHTPRTRHAHHTAPHRTAPHHTTPHHTTPHHTTPHHTTPHHTTPHHTTPHHTTPHHTTPHHTTPHHRHTHTHQNTVHGKTEKLGTLSLHHRCNVPCPHKTFETNENRDTKTDVDEEGEVSLWFILVSFQGFTVHVLRFRNCWVLMLSG